MSEAERIAQSEAIAPGEAERVAQAYRHCESLTREQAGNFYYAIRLLPLARRRAICAVYAFARRVDDIADGTLEPEEKLRRLDVQAHALAALSSPASVAVSTAAAGGDGSAPATDPVMVALADTYERFPLPPAALEDLIEGMRMDVNKVAYERFEDLVPYCRRVAGSIGRVSLAIFGARDADLADRPSDQSADRSAGGAVRQSAIAGQLADDLGVAMQLTNILRDLREDAENFRLYIPMEDLRRFGEDGVVAKISDAQRAALIRFEAQRARAWFERGMPLVAMLDRRSAACVLAMAGIYSALLDRIEADPGRVMRERISLPAHAKVLIAARSLLKVAR